MRHSVTLRHTVLSEEAKKVLTRYTDTLQKKLTNFSNDSSTLSLFIKRHDKNHFYSGVLTLRLPKQLLTAQVGSHSLEQLIKSGFAKINKEFETYKGKHFKGSSKYPYHSELKIT